MKAVSGNISNLLRNFLDLHIGRAIGTALFFISLFAYRSHTHRPVLGLWSYPFFLTVVFSSFLFLVTFIRTWRAALRRKYQPKVSINYKLICVDLSMLFWGSAYFISTMDARNNAARILDLNFTGSVVPPAVLLEWLALMMIFSAGLMAASSRFQGKYVNVVLILSAVSAFILLSEGFVRIKAVIKPIPQGFPTYTTDLWQRRYVSINTRGFRDVEHTLPKGLGTRRLLVVGDSFAFGWGINRIENRFGEELAKKLKAKTRNSWESINASRPDTHTLQHIDFLKQSLAHKPDIVILLYVFNDMDYIVPITQRSSYEKLSSRFNVMGLLYRNFYLFQELFLRLRLAIYRTGGNAQNQKDPYDNRELLSRHFKDLCKFVQVARQAGSLVRVVPIDTSVIIDSSHRRRYEHFFNDAMDFGIPIWSLGNTFDGYQFPQLRVNIYDGHPNELANSIAAEVIANEASGNFNEDAKVKATCN
ncbi:MAG: SGNH/GDSL hydrolase family protein [Desulfobacterales bacterium]|nr:SGNH/GDSL hydrolase family protein [Desulfobacterales bacterium]